MLSNVSFSQYLVGKLRQNLVDPNSNRTSQFGNWIYADKPQITTLMKNKNNFPRVSCELMNQPTVDDVGIGCESQIQEVSTKITVWSPSNLICEINKVTDESHQYNTGTDIYLLDSLPYSDINSISGTKGSLPYIFIKNVDFEVYDSTGSGMRNSVNWIGDIPDNGTNFLTTYVRNASAQELCRYVALNIHSYLQTWRDWSENLFWNYELTNSSPIDLDNNIGISRYEMTTNFQGINIGEVI